MDIKDDDDRNLALKIVNKMLRKTVVGSHKKQVDTVKGWVATHNEKRAEALIREVNYPDLLTRACALVP